MRHILVPPLIGQQVAAGRLAGRFDAVCLFVDTSGFTPLTTAMMVHGVEGAEAVADALAAVFEPLAAIVYAHGGFIAAFAGDAFKAIFPLDQPDAHRRAVAAAWEIRSQMAGRRQMPTPFGVFDVAVKATVADGKVAWGVWLSADRSPITDNRSPSQRALYWFEGDALARCMEADPLAAAGEVVLTDAVLRRLIDGGIAVAAEPVDGHWRLERLEADDAPSPSPRPAHDAEDAPGGAWFYPAELLSMPVRGEFRRVVTVFLNLPAMPEDGGFADALFRLLAQYRGYLCRVGRIGERDRGATLLLFWGAPASHENDLARALGFVLDLRQAHPAVSFRAGVTTGQAFAGFIGSAQREEYTCHGVTVNLAARLMVTAGWGEVWLDEETARQAQGQFDLDLAGRRQLKGFAEPRPLFRLAGRRETGEASLYRGAMVGRSAELAQLQAALRPLVQGRNAGVIALLGEAGLGKSRLAHELRQLSIDNEKGLSSARPLTIANWTLNIGHFSWALCPCDDILPQSLHPFRYWLRRHFEQSGVAGEDENKARFEQALDQLIAATPEAALAAELQRTRSVLGALLDLRWEGSLYDQLDAQGRFDNTLLALKALVKAESLRRPLVLHVEDAHWLDTDSRLFLARLARNVTGYPFVILVTARPEWESLALDPATIQHKVLLEPLPAADVGQLASQVLGQPAAPILVALLVERAEGNPFFAEQLLFYLRENGLLTASPAGLAPAGGADAVPLDVRAVLVARIDRLAAQARRVVQTAAVLGREFELRILQAMLAGHIDVAIPVQEAAAAAIWTALNEMRYLFRHALLRDAAYTMQLLAARRELHRLAGEAMEQLFAADLAPYYGQLAYHFEQAGMSGQARLYLALAGDQAVQHYHNDAAIEYYRRLLDLLDAARSADPDFAATPAVLDATIKLADVLMTASRWKESQSQLERAMALAGGGDDVAAHARAQALLGFLFIHRGDLSLAQHHLGEAVAAMRSAGLAEFLPQALNRLGTAFWRSGDGAAAMSCFDEALAMERGRGDAQGAAMTLAHMASVWLFRGELPVALQHLQEAFRLYQSLNRPSILGTMQINLALVYERMGEDELALENYGRALQLGRALGVKDAITRCLGNMGNLLRQLGRFDEAQACFLEAMQIDQERGSQSDVAWHYANLGELACTRGDYRQAVGYFEQTLPELRARGSKKVFAEVLLVYGEALLALQRVAEARSVQQEARALAMETGLPGLLSQSGILGARLSAAEGDQATAEEALRAMLISAQRPVEQAALHYELWRLSGASQHGQAALALYRSLAVQTANIVYRRRIEDLAAPDPRLLA